MKQLFPMTLSCLFLLVGCSQIASNYAVNPVLSQAGGAKSYIVLKDGEAIVETNSAAFQTELKNAITPAAKQALAFQLMSLSDEACEKHKSLIISNANAWNIGTGSVTNVLAGLGTVVGGESAKAALSAGAALSNSSRSLVNEQLYANALATTILRSIELKRAEAKKQIADSLKADNTAYSATGKYSPTTSAYSAYQLVYDVDYYHQQCSFMVGMVELAKALDNRKPTQADIKDNIAFLKSQLTGNGTAADAELEKKITELQLSYDKGTK